MTEVIEHLDALYLAAYGRLVDPSTVDYVGPELHAFVAGILNWAADGGPAIDYVKERMARQDANEEIWGYFLASVKWREVGEFIEFNLEIYSNNVNLRQYWSNLYSDFSNLAG